MVRSEKKPCWLEYCSRAVLMFIRHCAVTSCGGIRWPLENTSNQKIEADEHLITVQKEMSLAVENLTASWIVDTTDLH